MSESKTSANNEQTESQSKSEKPGTTRIQLLFRIGMLALGVFLLLGVVGWFLPRDYVVSTSIEIDAPPAEIYTLIQRADLWPTWSPSWDFAAMEKVMHLYTAEGNGVNWRMEDMVGGLSSGKMWISERYENERIEYYVDRDYKVFNYFDLEPLDDGLRTKVSWTTEATLPRESWTDGLFYGWAGLVYSPGLRGQYDADLARLKKIVEDGAQVGQASNQDAKGLNDE